VKVEVLAEDESAQRIAESVAAAARTDSVGDGKIWTTEVAGVMRIRTGERDNEAI
jgi:nitrogen regulatory protein PII